jgi:hypothetical protein
MGLFRPVGLRVGARAAICILIGWFPLVVFVLATGLGNRSSISSFLKDYGVHTRSLLAAPLFILCELSILRRLDEIAHHFIEAGLIENGDRPKFRNLIESTKSLMNSTIAEIVALGISYLIALLLFRLVPTETVPSWYLLESTNRSLSAAGSWYVLVSVPLLMILFLGWLWRVVLWGRFLSHVAAMKLRLISAHPDHAAGLKFLNESIFAFMPLAFSVGLIVAGAAANRVAYQGVTWEELQKTVGGFLIAVLLILVGPLMVFVFKLHRQKVIGIFSYGQLADAMGRQFERKWFTRSGVSAEALEAPDFSATTDLYQVVSNVYEMGVLPFELRAMIALCVSALLPFLPVVVMTLPLKVILRDLASLLF